MRTDACYTWATFSRSHRKSTEGFRLGCPRWRHRCALLESLRPRTRSLCPAPLHAVDVIACSPLMAVKCLQMAPSCGCVYLHNCEVWVPKALPPTQLASDSDGRFLTCPYSHLGDKATDSLGHWQEGGDRGGGY